MRRRALVALTLGAIAAMLSHLYLQGLVYHPVVRLVVSDRLKIVAVLPATKEYDGCRRANEHFMAPFRSCKDCRPIDARCERELTGVELEISRDAAVQYPVVVAKDLRIAVMGPPEAARASCDLLASNIAANGMRSAVCIRPKQGPDKL
jgi:hypothetical protein